MKHLALALLIVLGSASAALAGQTGAQKYGPLTAQIIQRAQISAFEDTDAYHQSMCQSMIVHVNEIMREPGWGPTLWGLLGDESSLCVRALRAETHDPLALSLPVEIQTFACRKARKQNPSGATYCPKV